MCLAQLRLGLLGSPLELLTQLLGLEGLLLGALDLGGILGLFLVGCELVLGLHRAIVVRLLLVGRGLAAPAQVARRRQGLLVHLSGAQLIDLGRELGDRAVLGRERLLLLVDGRIHLFEVLGAALLNRVGMQLGELLLVGEPVDLLLGGRELVAQLAQLGLTLLDHLVVALGLCLSLLELSLEGLDIVGQGVLLLL